MANTFTSLHYHVIFSTLDTFPSRILTREYRLALSDEKREAKELKARKAIDRRYAS